MKYLFTLFLTFFTVQLFARIPLIQSDLQITPLSKESKALILSSIHSSKTKSSVEKLMKSNTPLQKIDFNFIQQELHQVLSLFTKNRYKQRHVAKSFITELGALHPQETTHIELFRDRLNSFLTDILTNPRMKSSVRQRIGRHVSNALLAMNPHYTEQVDLTPKILKAMLEDIKAVHDSEISQLTKQTLHQTHKIMTQKSLIIALGILATFFLLLTLRLLLKTHSQKRTIKQGEKAVDIAYRLIEANKKLTTKTPRKQKKVVKKSQRRPAEMTIQ